MRHPYDKISNFSRYGCALQTQDINMLTVSMLKCLCAQGLLFTVFTMLAMLYTLAYYLYIFAHVCLLVGLSAGLHKSYFIFPDFH